MTDETELRGYLTDLADSGRRQAVPVAPASIRAHGERRLRRRRAALTTGGALLAVTVVVGGWSLAGVSRGPEPPAVVPTTPTASPFVPPTPAPGQAYASELGYVHGAVADGEMVNVTVEQLSSEDGTLESVGVTHTLTLPGWTRLEVRELAGGTPTDLELSDLVEALAGEPRWVFAIDYDSEGRVASLREAYWLTE
ncbi:hypothetical protein RM844_20380 [Streptomyces sp. DSM 44915]|uniref:Uncharacterized protein n=1 Tax=Streptomyces chisholmiae TaxID=3075540 RepID=A0ABU2JUI2_9ACTN|nr:hypothetical protein [Streptomyces sp. DSM 44915]MDT0268646.1 hypothetical protein [Streptomyces sp. DSM 44915]